MDVREENGFSIVKFPVKITHLEARKFEETIQGLAAVNKTNVIVDAGATEFIDSSGVGLLVSLMKLLRNRGGDLRIRGLGGMPLELFQNTGLDEIFTLYGPQDEPALQAASEDLFGDISDLDMDLSYEDKGDVGVFHFSGLLNSARAVLAFKQQALLALKDKRKLILDFADLTYFDDAVAAKEITNIARLLKTSDGEMRVSRPRNLIEDLQAILGDDVSVETFDSVEEALKGWK